MPCFTALEWEAYRDYYCKYYTQKEYAEYIANKVHDTSLDKWFEEEFESKSLCDRVWNRRSNR